MPPCWSKRDIVPGRDGNTAENWRWRRRSGRTKGELIFRQKWWLQLSYVLGVISAILLFHRFRLCRLTRQSNLRFEKLLAARTPVAVEGRPQPLHPVRWDEVYRIGREALVSDFRHVHA